jgi:RNA polymerase sigma-70 factor (ECF subfamily)
MTRVDDGDLVRSALAGDQDAYTSLYVRHRRSVMKAIFRYCELTDLDDMIQVAFAQIFSKMGQWNGDSQFGTWMHRVAVNQVLMEYRKIAAKVSRNSLSIDGGNDGLREFPKWEPWGENRDIEIARDGAKLLDAVEHLCPSYKFVTLCRLQEMTIAETAEELQLSIGAVKAYRCRAEKKIRKYIEKEAEKRKRESGYA